ncbi:TIGR00180 family glycosyltransferase [Pelagibacteraceae bacterium]|nr:TIGR00180 family glycosyltransferase [Pelagibacteraceae bacterium]
MDLTILIPTRNRFEYLKKIINYYQNFNFKGKIFLIDSSNYSTFQKTQNFLKKNNNRKVKHFRIKGRPFECIKSINSKIKTKFVCFSGDDDYYIVSGLNKSIKILKKNKKIDAINGLSIAAKIKNHEKLSIKYLIYNNYYSTLTNPTQRVIKILKNYQVPLFSIFRTNLFKRVMTEIPDKSNRSSCPTRIF